MRRIFRRLHWFWQRRTRGFDDTALYSLDDHLTDLILPRIRAFAQYDRISYSTDSPEEWQRILDEIVWTFDFLANEKYDITSTREQEDRAQRGLALFGEWYSHLWD